MNLKIYLIEQEKNSELKEYLSKKYIISDLFNSDVVIIDKVFNINLALDIVDYALMQGKEIICFKNSFAREHYVANYLIKNGAMYV